MYTPHTVTVYNASQNKTTLEMNYNITILEGVFLDIGKSANIEKTGLSDADRATLFIPFSVHATDGTTGNVKQYVPPKQYRAMTDPSSAWTLEDGGKESGVDCFFIKGNVVSSAGYAQLRKTVDYVFTVSTVDLRDFGSEHMRHWQVGGR